MSRRRSNNRRSGRGGFSLVEVLIAVLILALGLLGLGAVFPVIVREQKIGNDIIIGTMAGNSARALLQGIDYGRATLMDPGEFWREVRDGLTGDSPATGNSYRNEGAWMPAFMSEGDRASGRVTLLTPSDGGLEIPLAQRLYPIDSWSSPPQFVWDIAVQRVIDNDGDPDNDDLRVAIFVRRLDPRLRPPPGKSVLSCLTETPPSRVPVAEDMNGAPTLDGIGGTGSTPRYSQIRTMPVTFDYDATGSATQRRRDRLYVRNSVTSTVEWRLARQPNQKLIDNLGNVYTVMESGEEGGRPFLRVSPEVPAFVTENDQILEVAFTPQVAAAIVTWRVTP